MKEDKKKIDRSEEEKKARKEELEDKKRVSAKGVVAGSSLATLGTALALAGHDVDRRIKKGVKWEGKIPPKTLAKGLKRVGYPLLAIGAPALAVSAYKHHKYKKQSKEEDDN